MNLADYKKIQSAELRSKQKRAAEEHKHQAAFFKILFLNEKKYPFLEYVFAVPNGGARNAVTGAILQREGVKRGVPDIWVPIPNKGFHGLVIENKSAGGELDKNQIRYRDFLTSQHYFHFLCRNVDEQIAALEWYLGIELSK